MAELYDHLSLKPNTRLVAMRYFLNDVAEKVFQSLAPTGQSRSRSIARMRICRTSRRLRWASSSMNWPPTCLKYAFPDDRPGHVTRAAALDLSVCDNGVGLSKDAILADWAHGSSSL